MRKKVCERLPANHPYQPPMIEPLRFVPTDAKVMGEYVGLESSNRNESPLSHPKPTTHISKPSILENLVNHYSGELPGVESNLEKASEVASSEVALESPQQQASNVQMASTTCPNVSVPEHFVPKHSVPEQLVYVHIESHQPESDAITQVSEDQTQHVTEPEMTMVTEPSSTHIGENLSPALPFVLEHVNDPPFVSNSTHAIEINTSTAITTDTTDIPSSSNLAIQPCSPAKTNVPSPPTLFLESTILADVCENIFQELNKLVQARNNLIHKDSYEKRWKRLKERVDFVLTELQRSCLDAQDSA
jgi:hypothetical protein